MAKRNDTGLIALLGLGAIGAFFLLKKSASAAVLAPEAAGATGAPVIPELPGAQAPTSGELAAGGSFWDTLTPVQAISSGFINFPSGSQAAASEFLPRMDQSGNYYVQWAGQTYGLGAMDANGNWPAILYGS